ncbi:hypothetical protein Tco_0796536 [Tanacetum coccineum]
MIDNKIFSMNVEVFRDILNICPKVPGKAFDKPHTKEEALSFIYELGHTGDIKYITDVIVDYLHQPWRTFASIINKCLCGKVFGLDKIRLSRVQILWGMYYKKNLDLVALIWEDLAYQIDNIDSKKQDKMFYPRFTKIIIHHFLTKDKFISWRNKMFMHTIRDDSVLDTMRFVCRPVDTQIYGAILPQAMTNQALLDSVAYKTYYEIALGAEPPKPRKKSAKAKKVATTKPKPTKKKASVKADKGIDEGTSTKPGVLGVPKYDSESEKESWGDSGKEDDDDKNDSDNDGDNDDEDDDEITKELYNDVNMNLGNTDVDITDDDQGGVDQQNVSQELGFEQVEI